jgi:hypothetical protein
MHPPTWNDSSFPQTAKLILGGCQFEMLHTEHALVPMSTHWLEMQFWSDINMVSWCCTVVMVSWCCTVVMVSCANRAVPGCVPGQGRTLSARSSTAEGRGGGGTADDHGDSGDSRFHVVTVRDSLRAVVERLAQPGAVHFTSLPLVSLSAHFLLTSSPRPLFLFPLSVPFIFLLTSTPASSPPSFHLLWNSQLTFFPFLLSSSLL